MPLNAWLSVWPCLLELMIVLECHSALKRHNVIYSYSIEASVHELFGSLTNYHTLHRLPSSVIASYFKTNWRSMKCKPIRHMRLSPDLSLQHKFTLSHVQPMDLLSILATVGWMYQHYRCNYVARNYFCVFMLYKLISKFGWEFCILWEYIIGCCT